MLAVDCGHEGIAASQFSIDDASARNRDFPIDQLSPVSNNADGRAKSSVDSHGNRDVKESHILRENDVTKISNGAIKPIGCTKPIRPSKLNPNYLGPGGNQSRASVSRDQGRAYTQTPPDNLSTYSTSGDIYDTAWLPETNNAMHLGYHKESNERTKILPDNSIWQWPSNLIGQYHCPLSANSNASPPIVQTPLSNNAPALPLYRLPNPFPPVTSTYPNISYTLASQGDQTHHIGVQVNPNGAHRSTTSEQTDTSRPVTGFARSKHPISVKQRAMTRPPSGKATDSKKRPRTINFSQTVPATNGRNLSSGRMSFTQEDYHCVQAFISAMNDMSASEDNEGMIRSWDKMRLSRAARITVICEELLITTKKAVALNGRSLCDRKRSSNKYATFDDRFNAICTTLRTQKTVCKHLMEEPYLHQVVDDPIYASMRVANNRRVNKGKKVAIEHGRKVLGLKGNGKGRPLVKNEGEEAGEEQFLEENASEDGDYSDDPEEDEEEQVKEQCSEYLGPLETPTLRDRSTLKKPTYVVNDSDGVVESVEEDEDNSNERSKRQKRSDGQEAASIDSTEVHSRSHSEDISYVKTEPETRYSITHLTRDASPSKRSPLQELAYPFSVQENTNGALLPYDQYGHDNGYVGYNNVGYQQLGPPLYPNMQLPTQHQLQFAPPLDIGFQANDSYYDSSSNADNYTTDPVSDETNVPAEFLHSEWLQNHLKHASQD